MWIIGWIILGAIAGFIASRIVNHEGEGFIGNLVLGVIGAVVGGELFQQFGYQGTNGAVTWYSLFVSVIGAIVVLWIYHLLFRRRTV